MRAKAVAMLVERDVDASVPALLRELIDEVKRLRLAMDHRDGAKTLSRADRVALERLLPAVAGTMGSELFVSAELVESEAPALRVVCVGLNARRLGRLLQRASGTPIDGHLVERVATEAGAAVWRVVIVPEFSRVQNLPVPPDGDERSLG